LTNSEALDRGKKKGPRMDTGSHGSRGALGESQALSPSFSGLIYPVDTLVERADPARLRVWVDAEHATRGDLFFIERLVLAIEAMGSPRSVDVRQRRHWHGQLTNVARYSEAVVGIPKARSS
jgi:hypothetical protein